MPLQADLKRVYKCRCGDSHPQISRLGGGTVVMACPAYDGDLDVWLDGHGIAWLIKGTGARYTVKRK